MYKKFPYSCRSGEFYPYLDAKLYAIILDTSLSNSDLDSAQNSDWIE